MMRAWLRHRSSGRSTGRGNRRRTAHRRFHPRQAPSGEPADDILRSAVARQFPSIGEALMRIRPRWPQTVAGIPDSRRSIRFRIVLVPGYDVVCHEAVWDVVQEHPGRLARELDGLPGRRRRMPC
jgi:uncharacterized protein with HEPN domain